MMRYLSIALVGAPLLLSSGCATLLSQGATPFEVTVDAPAPGAAVKSTRLDTQATEPAPAQRAQTYVMDQGELVPREELRAHLALDRRSDYRITVQAGSKQQELVIGRTLNGQVFWDAALAGTLLLAMSALPQAYGPQPANAGPFCALGLLAVGLGVDFTTGSAWHHHGRSAYFAEDAPAELR
jgi:hypothetical protein